MRPDLPPLQNIRRLVTATLAEDLQPQDITGDLTTSLIERRETRATMKVRLNESAVLCGYAWFEECFRQLEAEHRTQIRWLAKEGAHCETRDVCLVTGAIQVILAAERCALNFLQTLSGTATRAFHYASLARKEAYQGQILDTRKTLPGLREAQKYAVRLGGCKNHRAGLYDAILIKENHIIAAEEGIAALIAKARRLSPKREIILETENLAEFKRALAYPVDVILLDNFSVSDARQALQLKQASGKKVLLEISGVGDERRLIALMKLQPDRISLGNLTKHLSAIDFSARLMPPKYEDK